MSAKTFQRTAFLAVAVLAVSCTADDESFRVVASTDSTNVLRAEVSFTSDEGGEVVIEVADPDGEGLRVTPPPVEPGDVSIPVLGLEPDTAYTVDVTHGEQTGSTSFTTGPLPADMPPIEVDSNPEAMQPGVTLFNVTPFGGSGGGGPSDDGYLLAVDESGDVVWYHRQTHSIQDLRQTDDGDLLFIHHETGVKRLDVIDGSVTEWSGTTGLDDAPEDEHGRAYAGEDAIRVDTDQMHHEVIELPNGNLMTLSRELREIDGFPEPLCDEEDDEFDGSYEIGADTVVEFDPETGEVIDEWSLFDMVDPLDRLDLIKSTEFCGPYLDDVYPDLDARDWTHSNAVVLNEERNALLVSVRHLDQVFAIRYQDDDNGPAGELMWELGPDGDFTLTEGEWFLHPHAPQLLDDGSIIIYDNGNERPGTSLDDPENLPYSRAVHYEIDVEAGTAEQVWEHVTDTPDGPAYAPFVGDADVLDSGTVLITHGGLLDPPAHTPREEGVVPWAMIVEVDYETGEEVMNLRIKDPAGEAGWIIYRAERIESIYPPDYAVETIGA
ncbi:MAG: aryl-sulfate sulfotransferase [Actinomycetota bacterium]